MSVRVCGSFVPYPYTCEESVELRRYVVEKGSLATPLGRSPYTIVRMKPFSCVLPVVGAGTEYAKLLLVRQYRYAVDGWQLELPAGGIESGETPRAAAERELREESGLQIEELHGLGYTYPSAGSTSEKAYLFAARCAQETVSRDLDMGEQIESVFVSRTEMEELLCSDEFAHAVTYAAWVRFAATGLLDSWMPR